MAGSRMFIPREACDHVFRLSPDLTPVLMGDCLNYFQLLPFPATKWPTENEEPRTAVEFCCY